MIMVIYAPRVYNNSKGRIEIHGKEDGEIVRDMT